MKPAAELRKAAEILRCAHKLPVNRPPDSPDQPNVCVNCGVHALDVMYVPDILVEPLTDWLRSVADDVEPVSWHALSEIEARARFALPIARAITGSTP